MSAAVADPPAEQTRNVHGDAHGRRSMRAGWFKVSNALIDQGWLRRLKPNELKVLLAFARFTFVSDGITLVGPEKIAAVTGISISNVRAATARLRGFKILITIDPGGGRNRACKRAIKFPETLPESGRESTPAKPSRNLDANPPEISAETLPKSGPKPSRNSGDSKDFSSKALSKDNSKRRVAAVDFDRTNEEEDGESLRAVLRSNGIDNEKVVAEICAINGISPAVVKEIASGIGGRFKGNRAGLLVSLLRKKSSAVIQKHARAAEEEKFRELQRKAQADRLAEVRHRKLSAILNEAAGRFGSDPRIEADLAALNGDRLPFALERLRALLGSTVGEDEVNAADHNAINVLAVEYHRQQVSSQREREERIAAAAEVKRLKEEAEAKAAREKLAAEQDRVKAIADFRASFSDESWKRQVAAINAKWPGFSVFSGEKLVEVIFFEMESGRIERLPDPVADSTAGEDLR